MDPVTAFSLAGTIFNFLESGVKIVYLAVKLHRSGSEALENVKELARLTGPFENVMETLESPPHHVAVDVEDQSSGLCRLAGDCRKAAEELLNVLRPLIEAGTARKRDAMRVALEWKMKENEINSYKCKLDDFRGQLILHLLVSLRQFAKRGSSEREEILRALGVMSERSSRVEGIADSILEFIVSRMNSLDPWQARRSLQNELVVEMYKDRAVTSATNAQDISLAPERRKKLQGLLISSLRYYGMEDREDRIAETFESTFEWVFHEKDNTEKQKWHNFREWLTSDNQVYWITGKAGSGKSTLMKYLCRPVPQEPATSRNPLRPKSRCQNYLQKWVGDKELVIASFYFWNSGENIQMAQAGLLRSLLYQILRERPDLIPVAVPSRWEFLAMLDFNPGEWKEVELWSALDAAVKSITADSRLCLFIDGLDEFHGSHDRLVDRVKSLAHQNQEVKLCMASRPWVVFETAFDTKPHLRLEDLSHDDIKYFVYSKLHRDAEFQKLQQREPEFADQLVDNIVSKASGVFLWVHLVVSSLLRGMSAGDRIVDLQQRLDQLPEDLEHLYDKLLQSLDPFYREHATQMIMLMEASKGPLSLVLFSFADEEDVSSITEMAVGPLSTTNLSLRLDAMVRRLNSRWKGLLEVNRAQAASLPHTRALQTVQYLHKTVGDFIRSTKVQQFLKSSLRSPFDPHLRLCIAHWGYLKSLSGPEALPDHVRLCLQHASHVLPASVEGMHRLFDNMSTTLPLLPLSPKSPNILPATKAYHKVYSQIGEAWGYETDRFGKSFLSLAVIHGVTTYVAARAEPKGLVRKPCEHHDGRTIEWPLLIDAFCPSSYNAATVKELLDLGADPNAEPPTTTRVPVTASTPWRCLLAHIASGARRGQIKSLASLSTKQRSVVEAMVAHGADIRGTRDYYIKAFTNRLGTREVTGISAFTDDFFKDLGQIKRRKVHGQSIRWLGWLGRVK